MKDQDGKLKWVEIFKELQKELRGGVYPQGVPLPSEEALVRRFDVSRITAVRAMEEPGERFSSVTAAPLGLRTVISSGHSTT